jgi:hypothetical protein
MCKILHLLKSRVHNRLPESFKVVFQPSGGNSLFPVGGGGEAF